jgi:nucleoside-diphosphate-sugar epimerase
LQSKNILFLGFGDLARHTARLLTGHRLVGVARSNKPPVPGVEFWQGAADGLAIRQRLNRETFDALVITLTPSDHSDQAYALGYVETMGTLLPVLQDRPPGLVMFISSTSVYHQSDGGWVDEDSPATPDSFQGRRLLEAEDLLRASGLPHTTLRCAGIYGPGRDFLLRQVRAGKGGSGDFTNRIHVRDAAGVIAHLLGRQFAGQGMEPLYLVCDSCPVPGIEVRRWLAAQLGVAPDSLQPGVSERGGNKRCSNRRLLASGYHLLYPSFRDGYGALLEAGELS